jgi:hypothetical protein
VAASVLNVMSLMKKNQMLAELSEKLIRIEKEAVTEESRDTIKKVAREGITTIPARLYHPSNTTCGQSHYNRPFPPLKWQVHHQAVSGG